MSVGIAEVDATATTPAVGLHVLQIERLAAVGHSLGLDPSENLVELLIAHVEGVMMDFEPVALIEVQGEAIVDADRGEVPRRPLKRQPEDVREEPGGCLFVPRGNDGVVQHDSHCNLPPNARRLRRPASRHSDHSTAASKIVCGSWRPPICSFDHRGSHLGFFALIGPLMAAGTIYVALAERRASRLGDAPDRTHLVAGSAVL